MKVVLAEKPSVARDLAAYLGATSRNDGWLEGAGYQVTWALGHLVELKEPQDYNPELKRWNLSTLPFVPSRFELKLIDEGGSKKQFNVVKRLFRGASELICATDAGREGELIFRFILEMAGCTGKPVQRLWLSSLTEDAIRDAFRRLKPASAYERLHHAARCRVESDWIVGLNATRFYTVSNQSSGHLWSVGRVQTPVLAMICERDDEIRTFRPEPFWELTTRYREVVFRATAERFKKEDDARRELARVVGQPFAITGIEKKPERVPPPQLYDLTELQRDMNRRYALSAAATLKAAQALYEAKLITYPRTDSRYITNDLKGEVAKILGKLGRPEVDALDLAHLAFTGRIVNDAKVTDHHAILPSGKRPGNLAHPESKIYEAIETRLIAAFYPTCDKEVTVVDGASAGVDFRARGVRVVEPGWTVLYPRKADKSRSDEQELPAFKQGESGPHAPAIERGETTPPKPYNENSLLGAMETAGRRVDDEVLKEALKARGLGTPATRAAIIETLIRRGYIERVAKNLAATDLGRYLIALIADRSLKSPEMTGAWEAKLREIEAGHLDRGAFMAEITRYIAELIRTGGAAHIDSSRIGDCPRCGKAVIEGKRGYGCAGWREGCTFVLWKEHRGQPLAVEQVRELVQTGFTTRPVHYPGARPSLLGLVKTGAVAEIPLPEARERSAPSGARTSAGSRPGAGARPGVYPRAASPAGSDDEAPRSPRGKVPRKARPPADPGAPKAPRAPKKERTPAAPGELGTCPVCKSKIVETQKAYGCSAWKDGCTFAIWKTIAGKAISPKVAKTLLAKGSVPRMKGFKSKAGKPFEAALKLEDGKVSLDFQNG